MAVRKRLIIIKKYNAFILVMEINNNEHQLYRAKSSFEASIE